MADRTLKRNDTYPPLRGLASGKSGPFNLTTASSLQVNLKGINTATVVTLTATPVWPVATDPESGETYNWEADLVAANTAASDDYNVELQITWAVGQVQTVPNGGYDVLSVIDDLG